MEVDVPCRSVGVPSRPSFLERLRPKRPLSCVQGVQSRKVEKRPRVARHRGVKRKGCAMSGADTKVAAVRAVNGSQGRGRLVGNPYTMGFADVGQKRRTTKKMRFDPQEDGAGDVEFPTGRPDTRAVEPQLADSQALIVYSEPRCDVIRLLRGGDGISAVPSAPGGGELSRPPQPAPPPPPASDGDSTDLECEFR